VRRTGSRASACRERSSRSPREEQQLIREEQELAGRVQQLAEKNSSSPRKEMQLTERGAASSK